MASNTITLTASMRSNLMSLKNIATQMSKTQNILSTGKKVNSAIDNASSYYQARSLSNRAADLTSLLDSMGQGIQTLQAANEGLESATAYLEQMKSVAEQATGAETGMLTSQVKLVDNSAELIAQGYIGVSTAEELKNALTNAKAGDKIVLMNDIDGNYVDFTSFAANLTINGGGHTLTGRLFTNGVIENISIEYNGNNSAITSSDPNIVLRNINIKYEGDSNVIYFRNGGNIENVNINAKVISGMSVINSGGGNGGDLNIKNLTMDLSVENQGSVTGVYSFGNINVDGMSIKSNAEVTIGLYSRDGTISGVNASDKIPSSLIDGYANTQAIVKQLGADGKAAYATRLFYVGDKNGTFGQGNWYLPSIGELMEMYGTDYSAITDGMGASGADGDGNNMTAINTTLGELSRDGIAEEMKGYYRSSSEYDSGSSWILNTSGGNRRNSGNSTSCNARAFRLIENCFSPSPLSGAEGDGIPKVGDIMYQDGSWGTLDEYKTSRNPSAVAGVIAGVGDDGSVRVVSLKDLTFSEEGDAGVFTPENPYGGRVKGVQWATRARAQENIEAITDMSEVALACAFNPLKGISADDINKAFAGVDASFYNDEFNKILNEYDKLLKDASYQGINLLTGGEMNVTFNEIRTHQFLIKGEDIRSDKIGLNKAEWDNVEGLNLSIESVQKAIGKLRTLATDLGNKYQVIQTRQDFTDALISVLETGADDLVLADMNETSAEYLMLQTRQQLAVNSLSLASQSASSILRLF